MERKTCIMCNIEKHMKDFSKKYSKSKNFHSKKGMKRYSDNKDKKLIPRKIHYE